MEAPMKKPPFKVVCVSDRAYLSADSQGRPRKPGPEERLSGSLTVGRIYEVVGEQLGMYEIVNNTGESYLYPKSRFRILDE